MRKFNPHIVISNNLYIIRRLYVPIVKLHFCFQDDRPASSATTYQFTDCDKYSKKKLQWCIFVCLALFVFRDFSCVHVFKKGIRCIFAELNVKPVTYEQCALLVTALQVTERSGSMLRATGAAVSKTRMFV